MKMKILAKIKKRPLILGILFTMLFIGIVYAAVSYQVNSGATSTIDEHTVCKKVTNNNALAIFVPTNTEEGTGLKSIEYGKLVAPLIEAVKEQQKMIDEQKELIDKQGEEIKALKVSSEQL